MCSSSIVVRAIDIVFIQCPIVRSTNSVGLYDSCYMTRQMGKLLMGNLLLVKLKENYCPIFLIKCPIL